MLWGGTPSGIPLSSFEITENGGGTHVREHKADFVEEERGLIPVVAPEIFWRRGMFLDGGGYIFFMVRHGRPNFCQFSPTNV